MDHLVHRPFVYPVMDYVLGVREPAFIKVDQPPSRGSYKELDLANLEGAFRAEAGQFIFI
jgi:hypothetical protein